MNAELTCRLGQGIESVERRGDQSASPHCTKHQSVVNDFRLISMILAGVHESLPSRADCEGSLFIPIDDEFEGRERRKILYSAFDPAWFMSLY